MSHHVPALCLGPEDWGERHGLAVPKLLGFFFFSFLRLHLQHMEVPRLRVELELQLPAYATVTAMLDHEPHGSRPGIEPASS